MDDNKKLRKVPYPAIFGVVVLIIFFYWFFSGTLYNFYANIVFFFYSLTHSIWLSVILLGACQTLLMIPFRIIRLLDFKKIREFSGDTLDINETAAQQTFLKRQFKQGNWTFTLYLIDFVVQLTSYISIGKLFLTDFYNKPLNPDILYSFVKYPEYPILDRFFKIPYPIVTKTIDFGWEALLYVWLLIIVVELIISIVSSTIIRVRRKKEEEVEEKLPEKRRLSSKYMITYGVIFIFFSYLLVRHFPAGMRLGIFTGDVAFQNTTFNTVTAVATFLTLMYFGINDIIRKGQIARDLGISQKTIDATQKRLFSGTFSRAILIGMGAFFITNQIPSAFELSIFTLEVISLLSPLTLDKLILRAAPKKEIIESDKQDREEHEIETQFSGRIEP